jgi:hypothetical protein
MAAQSTRKHRPSVDSLRELHADAEAVVRRFGEHPAQDMAEVLDHTRAVYVEMTLRWALGGYAPGIPEGLRAIQDAAAALREAAAPATEAEVFEGLAG